jgi:hypothetical protein
MVAEAVPYGRKTQKEPPIKDVHIVWITAGLGCDGDSVSITAATQPSIEDVLLGAIPGLPTVHLYNPVLAFDNGDDFLKPWFGGAEALHGHQQPKNFLRPCLLLLLVEEPAYGYQLREKLAPISQNRGTWAPCTAPSTTWRRRALWCPRGRGPPRDRDDAATTSPRVAGLLSNSWRARCRGRAT